MTRPLHVELLHIRRHHFGSHSGIHQFVPHLDRARITPTLRAVSDSDDDLPARGFLGRPAIRSALRAFVQRRGQVWYKLSDLQAERETLPRWARGTLDVLHFVDGEHTAQFLPWMAARFRSRGGTLATYHQPASILPSVVPRTIPRNLDRVVLVSGEQHTFFDGLVPAERIAVVPHGIDVDFFRPGAATVGARQKVRCLTTGSYLRDWKLLADIAERLRTMDHLSFDVVSASAPEFSRTPSVTVHRQVGDEALRALYQGADILLLPLVDATANNALLEGMASGLPVIASDLPALREYAAPLGSVFVPHDAEAFVAAIASMASDEAGRSRMGECSRQRAEAFAWPGIAHSYEALYAQVARERHR